MWNLLGGGLSALGSIYGAKQNADAQNQANVFNYDLGVQNQAIGVGEFNQNRQDQYAFAQNSAGWRIDDVVRAAKNNGINPLAALGVSGASFAPVPQSTPNTATFQSGNPGAGFSAAGQSLGRAVAAIQTPEQRASTALSLQNQQLQNEYLQAQINHLNSPSLGPGVPSVATPVAASRAVAVDPDKVTSADDSGVSTSGVHPEVSMSRTSGGGFYPEPSRDMSVAMFNPYSQMAWSARNMLLPTFDVNKAPGFENYNFDPFRGYTPKGPQAAPGTWGYYLDRNKWFGDTFQW